MQLRLLAATGMRIPFLCFGTASLHHVWSSGARRRLLEAAIGIGMTHVDTAPYYGDGIAEEEIGRLPSGIRSRITIATKFGLYPRLGRTGSTMKAMFRRARARLRGRSLAPIVNFDPAVAASSLDSSLRALHRESVDLLLLHEPTTASIDGCRILDWLDACRRAGKIRAWGIAGERHHVSAVRELAPDLAQILQTRVPSDREPDHMGLDPDFLYGCLREHGRTATNSAIADRLRAVHAAHPRASILLSTTRVQHLQAVEMAAS